MIAIVLSVLLPGILVIASLTRLLGCIKRRADGMFEYVWATGYSMVFCMAATWLSADLASLTSGGLASGRAALMVTAGPSLFIALGLILVLRPIFRFFRNASKALGASIRGLFRRRPH